MKKQSLTKQDVVIRQLETSIKLFFENRDLVSAYTLCEAANGVLEEIYKKNRTQILATQKKEIKDPSHFRFSISEEWEIRIKPEHKKEAFEKLREARNFFKHADKDHDKVLQFADFEQTGAALFGAIANYRLIFRQVTTAMSVFFLWYVTLHPNFLGDGNPLKDLILKNQKMFKTTRGLSRSEMAAIGYATLEKQCPYLFPPTDILSNLEVPRSTRRMKIPLTKTRPK